MRIAPEQCKAIRALTTELFGENSTVILFGSRVDDNKRGGDLDLLIESQSKIDNPAWLAARLSAKISRLMEGRSVDVIFSAPNLISFPIHEHAKLTGVQL